MAKQENSLISAIRSNMQENNNKISYEFIRNLAKSSTVLYLQPTPNMRLCILTLPSGHEVLGKAQVLDAKNDDEEIGNTVAYDNAVKELWAVVGSIAKVA